MTADARERRNDEALEAIRTLIAGVINRLDNFKTQGDATAQQVVGVHGELEAAMSKVSQNFRNMVLDFNNQHRVINALGENLKACREEHKAVRTRMESSMDNLRRLSNLLSNRLGEEMAAGVQLHQDMSLLMAWSKEMEDGSMVVASERLQRLEDRMAEKDAEVAALREQVR